MLYRCHTPVAPLGDFIQDFWLYDDYAPAQNTDRILPSGTIELVINLRDDALRIAHAAHPERVRRYSGALVSGAYSSFFVVDTVQEESLMGVHFKPGGAFPFLGVPAGDLADAHVNLEALWGRSAVELRERLCAATTPVERFSLLEAALMAHLFRPLEHHDAVALAFDAFGQAEAGTRIRDVARRAGLSQRRFIEVFTREVGMTPKLFCRVQRFHHVLALTHQTPLAPDWARLAVECGYFDQSHLIRDFLAFSGSGPMDYLQQRNALRQQGIYVKRNHLPLSG